jgi:hypothetical protein
MLNDDNKIGKLEKLLKDMTLEEKEIHLEKIIKELIDESKEKKGVGVDKEYFNFVDKIYKEVRKKIIEIDDEINDANDANDDNDLYWRMGGR